LPLPDFDEPISAAEEDRTERLRWIGRIAERAKPHSSKHGQDFLEWIQAICEGADPEAIHEAARADYEDEEEPWGDD
jgi:hypothetical protein